MQGYTISKPIGQGKFSIVYRAENEQGVVFALKKIKVRLSQIRSLTWLIRSNATSVLERWKSWRNSAIHISYSSSIPSFTTISSSSSPNGPKEEIWRSSSRIRKAMTCSSISPSYGNSWDKLPALSSTCTINASCIEISSLPIFLSLMMAR